MTERRTSLCGGDSSKVVSNHRGLEEYCSVREVRDNSSHG